MNIEINPLSMKSVREAQYYLRKYQDSLRAKNEEFVRKLMEIGIQTMEVHINESQLASSIETMTKMESSNEGVIGTLYAFGETFEHDDFAPFNSLMAIEFGAGIMLNLSGTRNPKEGEFGMGIGSFPGQVHAYDPDGWYYWDEDKKKWVHSFGVHATMPMHNTMVKLREEVSRVAKEVFGSL